MGTKSAIPLSGLARVTLALPFVWHLEVQFTGFHYALILSQLVFGDGHKEVGVWMYNSFDIAQGADIHVFCLNLLP